MKHLPWSTCTVIPSKRRSIPGMQWLVSMRLQPRRCIIQCSNGFHLGSGISRMMDPLPSDQIRWMPRFQQSVQWHKNNQIKINIVYIRICHSPYFYSLFYWKYYLTMFESRMHCKTHQIYIHVYVKQAINQPPILLSAIFGHGQRAIQMIRKTNSIWIVWKWYSRITISYLMPLKKLF